MTDIVESLRKRTWTYFGEQSPDALCHKAADAIESKDAEISRLRAALEDIRAEIRTNMPPLSVVGSRVDFIARAALTRDHSDPGTCSTQ